MTSPIKCPVCQGDGKRWPSYIKAKKDETPPDCPACYGRGIVWDFAPTYQPYVPYTPYCPYVAPLPWWQQGTICGDLGAGSVSIDTTCGQSDFAPVVMRL